MIKQKQQSGSFLLDDPTISKLIHGCIRTVNSELGNSCGYPEGINVRELSDRYLFNFKCLLQDKLGLSHHMDQIAVFGGITRRMGKYFIVTSIGLGSKLGSQVRFTMDFEVPKARVRRQRTAHLLQHL